MINRMKEIKIEERQRKYTYDKRRGKEMSSTTNENTTQPHSAQEEQLNSKHEFPDKKKRNKQSVYR